MNPNITLKFEHEHNDTIAFLDICIQRREDGSIRRSVYRKSTWTGQYLHFRSFVPLQYKKGLVRTLFHRAEEICTEDCLETEYDRLRTTLLNNGYPTSFIAKHSQINKPRPKLTTVARIITFIPADCRARLI